MACARVQPLAPVVYIPNWNGGDRLLLALASLDAGTQARVVVVDNGSSDGSIAATRERFPDVELLELEENLGFGKALNRAVGEIAGDPLIFLNNDVVCEPGFLAELLATSSKGAPMVAGVLLQEDMPQLIDTAGVIVEGDTLMAFDHLHGEPVESLERASTPLGPCGGAALFRREAFESLGGFDERIFIYLEDVDLALRAAAAGLECELARGARARHAYSASLGSRSGNKYRRTGWSRAYLLRRYGVMRRPASALRALVLETGVCAGQLVRDRTTLGLRGRIEGWRDAARLERRARPDHGLATMSLGERLRRRADRRR
jgi:GT2 family glycosyltransferase